MQVSEIMTPVVHTVQAETTLERASQQMRNEDVGFLPVVGEVGLTGTITDRDIVLRAIASGKDPKTTPVSEIMTGESVCCYEDGDSSEAAAVMEQGKVQRVLVLDRKEQVVGVVSLGDISAAEPPLTGEAMQTITEQGLEPTEQAKEEDAEMEEKLESVLEERVNPLS